MTELQKNLEFRKKYVALSFYALIFMCASLPMLAWLDVDASKINAVALGYTGVGAAFATVILGHFGFSPKDHKGTS